MRADFGSAKMRATRLNQVTVVLQIPVLVVAAFLSSAPEAAGAFNLARAVDFPAVAQQESPVRVPAAAPEPAPARGGLEKGPASGQAPDQGLPRDPVLAIVELGHKARLLLQEVWSAAVRWGRRIGKCPLEAAEEMRRARRGAGHPLPPEFAETGTPAMWLRARWPSKRD